MKKNIPNMITMFRIILIPVFLLFYFLNVPDWPIYAAIIFVIAALTDWLDGFLARKWDIESNFGKLWDPIADKLLVLAALLLLLDWEKIDFVIVLILVSRELIIGGVRALCASKGVVVAADMSGKIKTVTQFLAIPMLLLGFPLGLILIWVSALLSIYSCIEYIVKNSRLLKD